MRLLIRKSFIIIFCLFCLVLVGCGNDKSKAYEVFDKAVKKLNIPDYISNDIVWQDTVSVNNETVYITYNTDNEVLDSDGKVHPYAEEDADVGIDLKLTYNGQSIGYHMNRVVLSMEHVCQEAKESLTLPTEVNDDLNLPEYIGKVKCKWNSSNINLISKDGIVAYSSDCKEVTLTCTFLYKTEDDSYRTDKDYQVVVTPWSAEKRFALVEKEINIPVDTLTDIILPRSLSYDVECTWVSNDDSVINNVGNVNRYDTDKIAKLTAKLTCKNDSGNTELTYEVKVLKAIKVDGEMNFNKHILVNRAKDLNANQMTGLTYDESIGRLVLNNDSLTGVYESNVYNTLEFYRIVGSFSCITSEKATAELEYSIKVDGTWSKYLSYGEFGLGKTNVYYNQTDTNAMIDTDMVVPLNNKSGTAFKYRITLRRDSLSTESPALLLVASAIFMKNYTYAVDTSNLPNSVDWDVPKLNQNIVPKIGNVICSATTTTMLLKYAGYDFSDKGYTYEHEFMAKMVADTGHNNPTYGNWSYNMMAAGGFGATAYVGKYYSWDEIRYHLANYGPLGTSIGGNFGRYTTSGHLIVLRGYRIVNGETTVICNDPNITEVYYEVPLQTFLNCMGSVVYILEYGKEIINFK